MKKSQDDAASAASLSSAGFRVPVTDSHFGRHCNTGLDGSLLILYRGSHGWRAGEDRLSFLMLPGQIYVELLEPLIRQWTTQEIVAVEIRSGKWKTVWARKTSDVNYP